MQKFSFLIALLALTGLDSQAQAIRAYTLEVSCKAGSINSTQTELAFRWPYRDSTAAAQRVYRKNKETLSWGSVYKNLGVSDSTFKDTINTGSVYEYRFEKDSAPDGSPAQGFVLAGNRVAAVHNRGRILILADSLHKSYLNNDIRTYRNDLIGDGWYTELKWVDSNTSVAQIKSYIVSRYGTGTPALKSVVLIGNLAVPYSGDFSGSYPYPPDGHIPDHNGAWPCDMYYSCMTVPVWPDSLVTNTAGSRLANRNYPNDGKFDNYLMPDFNSLQIGRIDLNNMPVFGLPERDLLRRYFTKNHRFRHKMDVLQERCLLDDNFGLLGSSGIREHFANNAYRNMAALVSDTVTFNLDYRTTLNASDYLFSFGFGSGAYDLCTGIGYSYQLADSTKQIKSVFSGFLGSYFIDFDNTNNFLRAPLAAKGNVLNTFQCGRPDMFLHHMGLGESIGYSQLRTWNDFDVPASWYLYPTSSYGKLLVYTNLMGDPAVRMQPVYPASGFQVWQDSCKQRAKMTWTASSDTAVHTYYIYRSRHIDSVFTLIGSTDSNVFTDSFPFQPETVYMLRSEKLQISGSGTYFNLSQGLFDTLRLMSLTKANDTSVCLNSIARIGGTQNNAASVVYSWSPISGNRDTLITLHNTDRLFVLSAYDSIGHCLLKDSIFVSTLDLPLKDSMYFYNNACNDTLIWSSKGINGPGYTYSWTFPGASPGSLSAYMLDSAGMVVYSIPGNYEAYLTVSDTLTQCESRDSIAFTVICAPLPNGQAIVNCENTIKHRKVSIFVLDNTKFSRYRLESGQGQNWEILEEKDAETALSAALYAFYTNTESELRILALDQNGIWQILAYCDFKAKDLFSLHPNPAAEHLNIAFNGAALMLETEIEIFDYLGKSLLKTAHTFANGPLNLHIVHLPPGMYQVQMRQNGKLYTHKLIKTEWN